MKFLVLLLLAGCTAHEPLLATSENTYRLICYKKILYWESGTRVRDPAYNIDGAVKTCGANK